METKKRAIPKRSIKRYFRFLIRSVANILPLSMKMRANFYRYSGVSIEPGVVLMGKVHIDTIYPEDIHIGHGTTITSGVCLLTHYYDTKNLKEHTYYRGEIHIGRNCYIGLNTIFTKSVTVGNGSVIGAGSVVNKDIPPYQVWAGVPARFICNRYKDESEIPSDTSLFKPF